MVGCCEIGRGFMRAVYANDGFARGGMQGSEMRSQGFAKFCKKGFARVGTGHAKSGAA